MMETLGDLVRGACDLVDRDRTRLLDVARYVQERLGCVPGQAMDLIAVSMNVKRIEVESLVSFYAFLESPADVEAVLDAVERELTLLP